MKNEQLALFGHKSKEIFIKILNGMAFGLFSTLVIGLVLKQLGLLLNLPILGEIGTIAGYFLGSAIGVGVAYELKSPPLVIYSSIVTGALGAGAIIVQNGQFILKSNEPVGAIVTATVSILCGKLISGKTKLDLIFVPLVTIGVGAITATLIAPPISSFMTFLGQCINTAAQLQPIPSGVLLAVIMGILMVLPTSSAALSIALGINGLAAGAALTGCCCQMMGFAVLGYKDNGLSSFITHGIGTPKLQMGNIINKPIIWLPNIIAGAILGPLSITVFQMKTSPLGAGMGTSGLVGPLATLDVMGVEAWPKIVLVQFILPLILVGVLGYLFRKKRWIEDGDLKLMD